MKHLHRLMGRVFNTPLAIHSAKLDVIAAVMLDRTGIQASEMPLVAGAAEKREIYAVQDGGIAVIDISGSLVNRSGGMDALSGMTSYEEIAGELARAVADPAVAGIMLHLESPGGEALGLNAMAQAVRDAGKVKPVWASVDAYAYSAAYWIASACEQIYVPVDGEVGSIGTRAKHFDLSQANEEAGVKVTTVTFGAHKNDFSPDAPLSSDALARLQADVDELGNMFVSAVAKNRGMARSAVRATEALTYMGAKAVDIGLADQLGSFPDAMAAMRKALAGGKRASAPVVIVPRSMSDAERRTSAMRGVERRDFRVSDIRSADAEGPEPKISGHMAVFDTWSQDLGGFVEIIKPGAFAKTIQEADIHSLFNHDGNFVLGRVKSGTLRLSEDATGLFTENDPPDTQTIRDLVLEPIRRGDVDQGSIAFRHVVQEWGRMDGVLTRTLHEVRLYHVSPVSQGAYVETEVGLRAVCEEADMDYQAMSALMAKRKFGLPLSSAEHSLIEQYIEALQRSLSVAPGPKTHAPGPAIEPRPVDRNALETRLRRARLLSIQ